MRWMGDNFGWRISNYRIRICPEIISVVVLDINNWSAIHYWIIQKLSLPISVFRGNSLKIHITTSFLFLHFLFHEYNISKLEFRTNRDDEWRTRNEKLKLEKKTNQRKNHPQFSSLPRTNLIWVHVDADDIFLVFFLVISPMTSLPRPFLSPFRNRQIRMKEISKENFHEKDIHVFRAKRMISIFL